MIKLRFAAAVLGVAALTALPAGAQITGVTATFVKPNVGSNSGIIESSPAGSYYVGPYTGTIQLLGQSAITLPFNCVDFFHDVSSGSPAWTASLSNIGTGAGIGTATRVSGSQNINGSLITAQEIYSAAAYMVSTYPTPTVNPSQAMQNQTIAIQNQIWQMTSIFNPSQTRSDNLTYGGEFSTLSGAAQTSAINATAAAILADAVHPLATGSLNDWWVLTVSPVNAVDGAQEFIINIPHGTPGTTTPEPGTLTLLASGLAAVGAGVSRRRRRLAKAAE